MTTRRKILSSSLARHAVRARSRGGHFDERVAGLRPRVSTTVEIGARLQDGEIRLKLGPVFGDDRVSRANSRRRTGRRSPNALLTPPCETSSILSNVAFSCATRRATVAPATLSPRSHRLVGLRGQWMDEALGPVEAFETIQRLLAGGSGAISLRRHAQQRPGGLQFNRRDV